MKTHKKGMSAFLAAVMLSCFSVLPVSAAEKIQYTQMTPDWTTMADSNDMLATLINSPEKSVAAGETLTILGNYDGDAAKPPVDIYEFEQEVETEDGSETKTFRINGLTDSTPRTYTFKTEDPTPDVHETGVQSGDIISFKAFNSNYWNQWGARPMQYSNTWAAGYTVEISGLDEGEEAQVRVGSRYMRTSHTRPNKCWEIDYREFDTTNKITNGVYTFLITPVMNGIAEGSTGERFAAERIYLYYLADFTLSFDADVKVKVVSVNEALTSTQYDLEGKYDNSKQPISGLNLKSTSTVTYHDFSGKEIGTQTFEGATAGYDADTIQPAAISVPELNKTLDDWYTDENGKHWCFGGWSTKQNDTKVTVNNVIGTLDLYPVWVEDTRDYVTVTFKNDDGSGETSIQVPANTKIASFVPEPKKASTASHSFEFKNWEPEITEDTIAAEDCAFTAQYTQTERRYDVVFMAEDKQTKLGEVRVALNGDAEAAFLKDHEIPGKDATAQYSYSFDQWVDKDGKSVDVKNVSQDMTVYASYKATVNQYTVTYMDDDKKLGEQKVDFGNKAEIADPKKDATKEYTYKFVQWVDAEGKPADLSKIEADMTVYAEWESTLIKFSDVEKGKWYYTAVDYAYSSGILAGMSQTEFGINNETTRAMLVAVLYRQEGSPSVEGAKMPFTDVPEKEYYYDAVLWAYDNEVVFGVTDKTFGPDNKITREQLASILYRYAKDVKGYDVSYDTKLSLSVFEDKNDISSYAQEPIKFGMDKGYISGSKDNGILKMNPKKGTTRAEMASMVMRFLEAEHTPAK